MRAAILDHNEQNVRCLSDFIKRKYPKWIISVYATTFALATAVYDSFKGDVELILVHVEEDADIELAKEMQEYFPHIKVIFYSETTECAEKIFQAAPTFFLMLPFREENVTMALERVSAECEENVRRAITIYSRGRKVKIRFAAIRYIESFGRKMFLYTDNGLFETYMTVGDALAKLPPQFIQCHRSYIINSDKIEKYSVDEVVLTGSVQVPISRSFQKKIREILG
ncbi:MAG: LytTR family transcriptional regulator DNA-binding domain-containing protein [bacterium]|nr:LytTR family transcriptional regulator DNA-binding domain-containing protein [bacterium]